MAKVVAMSCSSSTALMRTPTLGANQHNPAVAEARSCNPQAFSGCAERRPVTSIGGAPKRNAIVPTVWASFYDETHVPAAVRVGDTLHVTGHTGEHADGTFPSDPEAQIRGTFTNIALTLAEAGMTWSDVVALTTYHIGLRGQTGPLLRVAAESIDAPFPAWTAVGVTELWPADAVVEISCIAVLGAEGP
jgi:enamine deaminase RidA (YjgF/YER057c/UK114 family)